MCITDGRSERADLFDTVLRQHLIKDANISYGVAKLERPRVGQDGSWSTGIPGSWDSRLARRNILTPR